MVFGGGAAGSFGSSFHFNAIADTLESYGNGIKTVGYFDSSPGKLDYTQLHGDRNWTMSITRAWEYFKYKDYSTDCAQRYPADKNYYCFVGPTPMYYAKRPFMLV